MSFCELIYYKVKVNTKFEQRAVDTLLEINLKGRKEILGFYLLESEGSAYWSNVLVDLRNRGVRDIFLACVYGLKGFPEAIKAVYPNTEIQQCCA